MKTYISIRVTHYSDHNIQPEASYYRSDGIHDPVFEKLTVDEANRLMWELIGLGGENSYTSNIYDNAISTRSVVFFDDF